MGASRPDHERHPNPFTGFDPADNFQMHELHPALLTENDFRDPVALANELMTGNGSLARVMAEHNMRQNLEAVPSRKVISARLVAALRKDLNEVLSEEALRENVQRLIGPGEQLPGADAEAQDQDPIVSNRSWLVWLYPEWIAPNKTAEPPRLMHVINTTLNLVGGKNLAWQQRRAEPFSISPLHAGCFRLGYRDSREYGDGISIGTAAATSGAAASSNMGYYTTSPVLSLLLTFFNVRLGWWLGNPGKFGNETYMLPAPKYSIKPVLDEAFGLTDDQNKYVYLTDGGHFENLGIYEMVLRRCHIIFASDGAQDEAYHFSDLGNAVRKIRIDLGIKIEFKSIPIHGGGEGKPSGTYWALGRIRYSDIDEKAEDGILLYFKPAVYGNEPRDVLEYKESYPAFPHQSTADQFFDEPQFESYRMLGSFIMEQLCGEKDNVLDLRSVLVSAKDSLGGNAVDAVLTNLINGLSAG